MCPGQRESSRQPGLMEPGQLPFRKFSELRRVHAPKAQIAAQFAERSLAPFALALRGPLATELSASRWTTQLWGTMNLNTEGRAADRLPIGVQRQLLVERRRVGHHLVLPAMVDHQLAVEILEDRRIARRVGDRQVHRAGLAGGRLDGDDAELSFLSPSTASATVA